MYFNVQPNWPAACAEYMQDRQILVWRTEAAYPAAALDASVSDMAATDEFSLLHWLGTTLCLATK